MNEARTGSGSSAIGRACDDLSAVATAGAALIVPLIYFPSLTTPFTAPKEAVLYLAAALCWGGLAIRLAVQGRASTVTGPLAQPPVVALAALLVLVGLGLSTLSAASTPPGVPYAGAVWLKWGALFGIGCGVAAGRRTPGAWLNLLQAVTASAAVVSVLGLWQHFGDIPLPIPVLSTPGSTFGNRNLGGEAVALSVPFALGALGLARGRGELLLVAGAIMVELLYLAATRTRGAWVGCAAGLATFALVSGPVWRRRALQRAWSAPVLLLLLAAGVAVALVAVLPGRWNPHDAGDSKRLASGVAVVQTAFDPESTALRTRLGLWRRSFDMFRTAPVAGGGPGNWAVLFPRFAEPGATAAAVLGPALSPRHAHNDLVESLTETGIVGLGCVALFAVALVHSGRRQLSVADGPRRLTLATAAGALVALVSTGVTGFPLEMPATVLLAGAAVGLLAAGDEVGFFVRASQPERARPVPLPVHLPVRLPVRLAAGALVALAFVAFAVRRGERQLRASWWLNQGERSLHSGSGPDAASKALPALQQAERATPGAYRVAMRMAQAQVRLHNPAEGTRAATAALAREPFSPNAWMALAAVQLDGGDALSALASAERSLTILHDYPYALFVAARALERLHKPDAAAAYWTRLKALAAAVDISTELGITDSANELLKAPRP